MSSDLQDPVRTAAGVAAATTVQLVCVSHRPDIYDKYVGTNKFVRRHDLTLYDNRVENIGIAARYNSFIENEMDDGWVVFMHHDFSIDEDPGPLLAKLPQSSIYGVIGTTLERHGRFAHIGRGQKRRIGIERGRFHTVRLLGNIKCRKELTPTENMGERVSDNPVVDTVDCCCVIVHSSLIRQYGLRFDEKFAWHFYSEDFSLNAMVEHGIETRVVQMDCGHYGYGDLNEDFHHTQKEVVGKYSPRVWTSTCYRPPFATGIERFAGRRGLLLQF